MYISYLLQRFTASTSLYTSSQDKECRVQARYPVIQQLAKPSHPSFPSAWSPHRFTNGCCLKASPSSSTRVLECFAGGCFTSKPRLQCHYRSSHRGASPASCYQSPSLKIIMRIKSARLHPWYGFSFFSQSRLLHELRTESVSRLLRCLSIAQFLDIIS